MSIIVAFLFASGSAAAAQPVVAAPAAAAPAAVKPAKEKKICKTEDSDPGSHMVKRTCKTQAEWDQPNPYGTSHSGFSISGDKMNGH